MKQLGFTLMLYVVVLSPLAAVCQTLTHTSDVLVPQDTVVQLRLAEGLSTKTDHKGYVVHLQLASDLSAGGLVVIPAGTPTTAKITISSPGYIHFSDPALTVAGKTVRLSRHTAAERGELRAETGAAIGIGICAAPLIVAALPVQAVIGLHHYIHRDHKKTPQEYVTMDPGEEFKYYV